MRRIIIGSRILIIISGRGMGIIMADFTVMCRSEARSFRACHWVRPTVVVAEVDRIHIAADGRGLVTMPEFRAVDLVEARMEVVATHN